MSFGREQFEPSSVDVLLSGGVAGIVTWTSIYPLDVLKTRLQAPVSLQVRQLSSIKSSINPGGKTSAFHIAVDTVRSEGMQAFYRGIAVCNLRAFGVNAVQVCAACPCVPAQKHLTRQVVHV